MNEDCRELLSLWKLQLVIVLRQKNAAEVGNAEYILRAALGRLRPSSVEEVGLALSAVY